MKKAKQLQEERGVLETQISELMARYKDTDATAEQLTELDGLIEQRNTLNADIAAAEKREAAEKEILERNAKLAASVAGTGVQGINKDEAGALKRWNLIEGINELKETGRTSGVVKEMSEEAIREFRGFGASTNGISLPARFSSMKVEQRTDIDQNTSAIGPTGVDAYVYALRERALFPRLGGRIWTGLTSDVKIPKVGKQTAGWLAAENTAAADGGVNFGSDTLSAVRLSSYVDISNLVLLQNGMGAQNVVMEDLGRAAAQLINTAMFNTSSVSNAPASFAATSGTGTFTELTYTANASILGDLVLAEQVLANNEGLDGSTAYVLNTKLLTDLKKSAQVASVTPAMMGAPGEQFVNGHRVHFTVACTSNGSTSADGLFADWSQCIMGEFGGLNIQIDPYSVNLNAETRLVIHKYVDWSIPNSAALVKFTSLLA